MKLKNLVTTLEWVLKKHDTEAIWCDHSMLKPSYLGFEEISQKELDELCFHVNLCLRSSEYPYFRIGNTMGEIVGGTYTPEQCLIIDKGYNHD